MTPSRLVFGEDFGEVAPSVRFHTSGVFFLPPLQPLQPPSKKVHSEA